MTNWINSKKYFEFDNPGFYIVVVHICLLFLINFNISKLKLNRNKIYKEFWFTKEMFFEHIQIVNCYLRKKTNSHLGLITEWEWNRKERFSFSSYKVFFYLSCFHYRSTLSCSLHMGGEIPVFTEIFFPFSNKEQNRQ